MRPGIPLKAAVALCLVLAGCTCSDTGVNAQRFACTTTADCADGFACRGGECRGTSGDAGGCVAGDTRACAISGCQQVCGDDGGLQQCAPTTGLDFSKNPDHCGECGRKCSSAPGLTCLDSHCSCSDDTDCPSGDGCAQGGLCLNLGDPCVTVRCPLGQVCRNGTCAATSCDGGCGLAEVCEAAQGLCRPISVCKFPVACDPGGICEGGPRPDLIPCNDGNACTTSDVCTAGTCGGTAYTCPPPTACQLSVACTGDGGCAVTNQPDGTLCDDGTACTFADHCQSGLCTGNPYTCTPDQCSATSSCAGDGGCFTVPRNLGAVCDDGNACTKADSCGDAGVCVGTTYSCGPPNACQQAVACTGDGGCLATNKIDGTLCDDGVACSFNDLCTLGACAGQAYTCPAPTQCQQSVACLGDGGCSATNKVDGTPCSDGVACTAGDHCVAGVCAGTTYACTPAQCAASSVCAGDGGCITTPQNVGTPCNDGNACSLSDSCNDAGACAGTVYTCPAPTQCQSTTACAGDGGCLFTFKANGTVCNDGLACTSNDLCTNGVCGGTPGTTYQDLDLDGVGNSAVSSMACPAPAGYVAASGDCNDSNVNIFQTLMVAADADHDGFTTTLALSSQCVGASSVINGRTYYKDSAGLFTWLGATSATTDCDDTNAVVLGPLDWYADADLDTFGAGAVTTACTAPVGKPVNDNTDCNDANANVFTNRLVYTDADQDGYTDNAAVTECTGASSVVNGRTYFKGTAGTFIKIATSLGADCSTGNAALFTTVSNVVSDNDRDGYPPDNVKSSPCTGATSTVGGRTYYTGGANVYWMAPNDCINRAGNNCTAPFDCYDLNSSALPGQLSFFSVHRGDGSFDYDCSGAVTSNVSNTYCSVTGGAQTFFTDGACTLGSAAGTLCTTSLGYSVPGACGKFNIVSGVFYNLAAVCTAATKLGPTQTLCR